MQANAQINSMCSTTDKLNTADYGTRTHKQWWCVGCTHSFTHSTLPPPTRHYLQMLGARLLEHISNLWWASVVSVFARTRFCCLMYVVFKFTRTQASRSLVVVRVGIGFLFGSWIEPTTSRSIWTTYGRWNCIEQHMWSIPMSGCIKVKPLERASSGGSNTYLGECNMTSKTDPTCLSPSVPTWTGTSTMCAAPPRLLWRWNLSGCVW